MNFQQRIEFEFIVYSEPDLVKIVGRTILNQNSLLSGISLVFVNVVVILLLYENLLLRKSKE